MNGSQEIMISTEIKNITGLSLTINIPEINSNAQLIIKLKVITQSATEPSMSWYLIPTIGLIPTYLSLILAMLILNRKIISSARFTNPTNSIMLINS